MVMEPANVRPCRAEALAARKNPSFTMSRTLPEGRRKRTNRSLASNFFESKTTPAGPRSRSEQINDRSREAEPKTVTVFGGADRDRTGDLKLAKLALSQLSYGPLSGIRKPEVREPISGRSDFWFLISDF